jgi:hypothetical protein
MKKEHRNIKIAGKVRDVEIIRHDPGIDVRIKVGKSHVLGYGATIAEAVADAEPFVIEFEQYSRSDKSHFGEYMDKLRSSNAPMGSLADLKKFLNEDP